MMYCDNCHLAFQSIHTYALAFQSIHTGQVGRSALQATLNASALYVSLIVNPAPSDVNSQFGSVEIYKYDFRKLIYGDGYL